MTAQDLKNSILQLAVQGKLVSQDPTDEPASELLNQIQTVKAQQVKNGLSIDKRHTPNKITNRDIPYDLPNSWAWVRFADIVSFSSGKTPERHNTDYWKDATIPWITISDMDSDGITMDSREKISPLAFKCCFADTVVPSGTLIMSFKLTIGKVSFLGVDATHNEAIISIFPFATGETEIIIKQYLFKILPLVAVTGNCKNAVKGKTLNAKSISNLIIPLPPLAEQQRIVAKIEELLPLIEEYDRTEKLLTALNRMFLNELQKSIFQQAVIGKLTDRNPMDEPASGLLKRIQAEKVRLVKEGKLKKEKFIPPITEDDIPFEIPEGWEWVRLQDVATAIVDCPHSTPKYLDNETGFYAIGTKGMNGNGEITCLFNVDEPTYLHRTERLVPQAGDIVYSREGSIICRAVILPEEKRICLGQRVMLIRCNMGFVLKFLQTYLMSDLAISYLTRNYKGTGVRHINVADVCSLPVPIPPLAEQQRIVERVEKLLTVCGQLK